MIWFVAGARAVDRKCYAPKRRPNRFNTVHRVKGKTATHSVVYARLIIKDVDYGVHAFLVQLRYKATPDYNKTDWRANLTQAFAALGFRHLALWITTCPCRASAWATSALR